MRHKRRRGRQLLRRSQKRRRARRREPTLALGVRSTRTICRALLVTTCTAVDVNEREAAPA
jgi:hypothetical protein